MSKEICGECHNRSECQTRSDPFLLGRVVECGQFEPLTNADHIHDMSDDQLSAWLNDIIHGGCTLPGCRSIDIQGIYDWLKQPYGGDNHA